MSMLPSGVRGDRFQADHAAVWRKTVGDAPLTADTPLMVELFEPAEVPA